MTTDLTAAKCVVVLWSKESIKSDWVKEEATKGKKRQILVPALIEPVEPPLGFGLIQAADLTDWMGDSNHTGFQLLISALTGLLDSHGINQPPPVPPQTEAAQEKRRIDTVAPTNATLGKSMDVFVQVRFPDSEYLSIKDWPFKSKPSSIEQSSKLTNVKYSKNSQGNFNPACLRIKIVAPEFKVEGEAEKKIEIVPKEFSDLISFQLTPQSLGEQRIIVKVSDENGISVGELPVETNVNDSKKPLVNEATIVVLDLNVLVLVEPSIAKKGKVSPGYIDEISHMRPTQPSPEIEPELTKLPRKRSSSKIGILSALTLLIVAGTTWMFVQQKTVSRPTVSETVVVPQPPVEAKPIDKSPPKKFTNSIGMEFVLIPAGSFTMGSSTGNIEEGPPVDVRILQSFYIQTAEVSQGQWKKVMGDNPSYFKQCGDDCPVENVSWDDVQLFIKKLNQLEKLKGYRLPSESEWEYACRAGTTTEYSFEDDSRILGEYAWYGDNSNKTTHPIATRKPNPWGLYDMHGNVGEWVEDDYHGRYEGAPADGRAWVVNPRGSYRVIRGGSWFDVAQYCRSAVRYNAGPDYRHYFVGFRLAMSVLPNPLK